MVISSPKPVEHTFVSVIVCAFNEERILRACLESLRAQGYPEERYEILIIDDGSTDRTAEIAEAFVLSLPPDSVRTGLICIRHGGLAVARNTGIRMSRGEILAFIDGDAVALPSWLSELVRPFSEGADYVGGRIDLLNTKSWVARFLQRTRFRQFFGPDIHVGNLIGCNMAFRRKLFDSLGGFIENFTSRGDETSLVFRIGSRFRYSPAPNAIVLHERPESLGAFVRTELLSSELLGFVRRNFQSRRGSLKLFLAKAEALLIALFPVLLVFLFIWPLHFAVPATLGGLALFRRLLLRRESRAILSGLAEDYGWIRGFIGHVFYFCGKSVLTVLGDITGYWKYSTETVIPPMTTKPHIVQTVQSHGCRSLPVCDDRGPQGRQGRREVP